MQHIVEELVQLALKITTAKITTAKVGGAVIFRTRYGGRGSEPQRQAHRARAAPPAPGNSAGLAGPRARQRRCDVAHKLRPAAPSQFRPPIHHPGSPPAP